MPGIDGWMATASKRIATRATSRPNGRVREVTLLMRAGAVAAGSLGVLEGVAGLAFGEPRAILLGFAAVGYGGWFASLIRQVETLGVETITTRIASVTLALFAAAAVLQPSVGIAMVVASLLPAVLVLPYVASRAARRILGAAGMVGIGSLIAGEVVPPSDRLPSDVMGALAFLTLVMAFALLIWFLWEVSRRMTTTADDLRSIVAMTNDLSHTLEPQLVGDRIARHIAQAVGATDCALSNWDRAGDRVVSLGHYPTERRGTVEPSYSLSDHPTTRTVLETERPVLVDAGDPDADPHEVALLHSIGHRRMLILPLVAAGSATGTIELTSERSDAFDTRQVEIAMMMAGEAALALENARLYDEIRHQALHDGLTGLANRVLFRDRIVHALERSAGRDGRPFAVLFIDLDDFKTLNDSHGHARGDDVLVVAAERVLASLRPGDTAARLGGDEFGVLLDDCGDEELALSIAMRLADTHCASRWRSATCCRSSRPASVSPSAVVPVKRPTTCSATRMSRCMPRRLPRVAVRSSSVPRSATGTTSAASLPRS